MKKRYFFYKRFKREFFIHSHTIDDKTHHWQPIKVLFQACLWWLDRYLIQKILIDSNIIHFRAMRIWWEKLYATSSSKKQSPTKYNYERFYCSETMW